MTMVKTNYNQQYGSLKHRISLLRLKLLYTTLNDTTMKYAEYLDGLCKELDMLFSEGRYFDDIEDRIEKLEE